MWNRFATTGDALTGVMREGGRIQDIIDTIGTARAIGTVTAVIATIATAIAVTMMAGGIRWLRLAQRPLLAARSPTQSLFFIGTRSGLSNLQAMASTARRKSFL